MTQRVRPRLTNSSFQTGNPLVGIFRDDRKDRTGRDLRRQIAALAGKIWETNSRCQNQVTKVALFVPVGASSAARPLFVALPTQPDRSVEVSAETGDSLTLTFRVLHMG